MLGLVPSMVKAWRKTGCMEGLDWSAIKCFSSTGECSNADDYSFLMSLANNRPANGMVVSMRFMGAAAAVRP